MVPCPCFDARMPDQLGRPALALGKKGRQPDRFPFHRQLCLNGMGKVLALPRMDTPEPAAAEAALLASLARGERAAAEELVDATYRRVFALLSHLSAGDRDLAADLTQETYRRAWAALPSFDRRARFSTWLYRIATNVFLNHIRRPHLIIPLEQDEELALPASAPRQDDEVETAQTQARLRRAVLALPDALRSTVILRYWAEESASEIARAEGLSVVAIRKRLRRAIALLARMLKEESL